MVLHQQLHSTPQIYEDDLVFEYAENGAIRRFGIVTSVAWEQDSDDSEDGSEDEDSYVSEDEEGEEDQEEGDDSDDNEPKSGNQATSGEAATEPETQAEDDTEQEGTDMVAVSFYPSFDEDHIEASKLVVKDRALLFDGIVARANNPLGQTGVVIDVLIKSTLLFPDNQLVDVVPTSALQLIHPFLQDVCVVQAGWVGKCVSCDISVTLEFEDGSICRVVNADDTKLPIPDSYPSLEVPYVPSMLLNVPAKTLKAAQWIKKSSNRVRRKSWQGVVIAVTPTNVEVNWMCSSLVCLKHFIHDYLIVIKDGHVPPPPMVPARYLTVLDVHSDSQWTVGDYAFCRPELRKGAPIQIQQLNAAHNNKKLTKRANELNVGVVVHTKTYVSVCWQDGSVTQERATNLVPVQHVLHADFWSEDFVIGKGEGSQGRVGVVKRVDAAQRTCGIMWLDKLKSDTAPVRASLRPALEEFAKRDAQTATSKGDEQKDSDKPDTINKEIEKSDELETEEVSMYAIESHPDFNYRLGCLVVRLNKDGQLPSTHDSATTTTTNTTTTTTTTSQPTITTTLNPTTTASVNDNADEMEDYADSSDDEEQTLLDDKEDSGDDRQDGETNSSNATEKKKEEPWVGQIINIFNGVITVHWVDGSVTNARPEELYRINEDDYDSESSEEEEDGSYEDEEEEEDENSGQMNIDSEVHQSSFLEQAASIFGTISRARWWAGDVVGNFIGINRNTENPVENAVPTSSSTPTPTPPIEQTTTTPNSSPNPAPPTSPSLNPESPLGPKFAVLTDSSGHYYASQPAVMISKFLKRMQQEWALLRANLPEGIFVRAYEDRMDLMSILFIGPAGTPYEDAVFLFHLHIPPTYPSVPPQLYYYCVGEQLNPNLYKNGNVCLSLLGTWNGRGVEVWQPQSSNILQVVLSVQGLILGTAHPYFLEAGYEKQRSTVVGMHNARIYNETIYLITVQSVIYNALTPPSPFEEVVKNHFLTNGRKILEKCRSHAQINTNTENNNNNNNTTTTTNSNDDTAVFLDNPSLGFKKSLAMLIVKLETALEAYVK